MGKSESLKIIAIGCKRGLIRDTKVKYRVSGTKEQFMTLYLRIWQWQEIIFEDHHHSAIASNLAWTQARELGLERFLFSQ